MIIFTTESFKIDLSHLNITFSENNAFFEKDLIKQQSFPFKIPKERSFIPFFEFIGGHNSTESTQLVEGTLFRNDKYYSAELIILNISDTINAIFYYNEAVLPILEQFIKTLPWANVNVGENMFSFASQKINVGSSELAPINFPKVSDPKLYENYKYGKYLGFINDNRNTLFFEKDIENERVVNEIRPFLYLKKILNFIFSEINYTVIGDFQTDEAINKCLLFHTNSIFYTNKEPVAGGTVPSFFYYRTHSYPNSGGGTTTVLYYRPKIGTLAWGFNFPRKGTYKMTFKFKGRVDRTISTNFDILFSGISIGTSYNYANGDEYYFDYEHFFYVDVNYSQLSVPLTVEMVSGEVDTINITYTIENTLKPLYNTSFNLKELLPENITVASFINSVKDTFNLTSIFNHRNKTVKFDFFETFINDGNIIDLSKYSNESYSRKLNKKIGYKIKFLNNNIFHIDKLGNFRAFGLAYTNKIIPMELLELKSFENNLYVKSQENLSILFYTPNSHGNSNAQISYNYYHRGSFIVKFLKYGYVSELNSEEYNITLILPIFIAAQINTLIKIFINQNIFIVHEIRRQNITPLFEKIRLRLFKIKQVNL